MDIRVCSVFFAINKYLREARGRVLDVGCGDQPYRFLVKNADYTGIDKGIAKEFSYKRSDVIYYEGDVFPVSDDHFDMVYHTEVLEHIDDPDTFLKDCRRVLRPGCKMIFTVPFNARFHYKPYDYYRYTPSGLNSILSRNGFKDISIKPLGTDIVVICYKISALGYRLLTQKNNIFMKCLNVLFVAILSPLFVLTHIMGMISLFCKIGSTDDPLGYFVLCSK